MVGVVKRAWWKFGLIAFLTLGPLAFEAPRLLYIGGYLAQLGAVFVHDVAVISPGSAPEHAGMRTGDRLDTYKLTHAEAARFRYQFNLYVVGSTIDVPVVRNHQAIVVSVRIERQRVPAYDRFVWIVVTLWGLAVLGVGLSIVIARPNIVTGAFLAFTSATVISSSTASYLTGIGGAAGVPYFAALQAFCGSLGLAGIISLCVRFPDGKISRPGRVLEVLGCGLAFAIFLYEYITTVSSGQSAPDGVLDIVFAISRWLLIVCFVTGFAVRYVAADPALRTRLHWVGVGLASVVAFRAIFLTYNVHWLPITYEEYTLASMVNILPFTFAYAVFRQRVIDVRFAGGRAVLYAIVSTIPFALFRITDWLVRSNLEQAKIAAAIEVIIAVAFGFCMSLAQRRVDAIVERTFFRARYRAERVVRDVIASLSMLRHRDDVDEAVVRACSEVMQFESAAIFERVESGYERRHAAGWEGGAIMVATTDPLLQRLIPANAVVYVDVTDLPDVSSLQEDHRPVIAVPVWRFERLDAIILVGRHRNGESPDPTEERIMCDLARSAGIAYARIDTAALERKNLELERKLEALEQPRLTSITRFI